METPKGAPKEEGHETASSTAARLLTDAEHTADIHEKLELLLRAWTGGEADTKKASEAQLAALGTTCPAPVVADVVKRLFRHSGGEPSRIALESRKLVNQVITTITYRVGASSHPELLANEEVYRLIKTFMIWLAIVSAEEHPNKITEVAEVILNSWDEQTSFMKCHALKLLRTAAIRNRVIAAKRLEVVVRGCQDANAAVRFRALEDIYLSDVDCPDKVDEVIDVAVLCSDDPDPDVSLEAVHVLRILYGERPERNWEIISIMLDKYDEMDETAKTFVVKHLTSFAEACPERIDDIYAAAMSAFGDEHCTFMTDAIDQLVEFVKFCPDTKREIVTAVLSAHGHEQQTRRVKESDVNQLVNLIKACPGSTERIAECMCQLCGVDFYSDCRVLERMGEVAALCPSKAEGIMETVLRLARFDFYEARAIATGKTREEVVAEGEDYGSYGQEPDPEDPPPNYSTSKECAVRQLGQLSKTVPQKADAAFKAVFSCWEYECFYVKIAAISQMRAMMEVCFEKAEEVVSVVLAAISDDQPGIRSVGRDQLPWLARACPERAEQFVQLLCDGLHDSDCFAGIDALRVSSKMMQACPEKAVETADTVLAVLSCAHPDTRHAVTDQLPLLAKGCPERAEQFVQLLCDECYDLDFTMQAAALGQLVRMMEACPSHRRELFSALLFCCGDDMMYVSDKAKELVEAALGLCPEFAANIVLAMIQCSDDADSDMPA